MLFLVLATISVKAEEKGGAADGKEPVEDVEAQGDSIRFSTLFNSSMFCHNSKDSLMRSRHKKTFFHRVGDVFTRFFREFNTIDTNYIEPQHYNYTVMLQNTNTYEQYTLSSEGKQSITFAPDPSYKLGPYLGWRWVFLGYTFDLKHISFRSEHTTKKELDLSLYSSLLGIDLFWRQTGNNYHIERMSLGQDIDTSPMKDVEFDGLKSSIKGFNLYYIFNHRRFSYPAAYSQSTVQRRSAGSVLAGIGYTRHSLEVDWNKFGQLVADNLGPEMEEDVQLDSALKMSNVKYSDFSISGGYGYNWVFAHNWLFNASLSLALAYKQSSSNLSHEHSFVKNFHFKNFNFDGIGRFGVVWNNTKWYVGMSGIIHSFNYKKEQFSTNSWFGNINLYIGVNFGRKRNH